MVPLAVSAPSTIARVPLAVRTAAGSFLKIVSPNGFSSRPAANEDNLRVIVDSVPGFVCTMSAAGEVEFVNQRILAFMDKTREEPRDWPSFLQLVRSFGLDAGAFGSAAAFLASGDVAKTAARRAAQRARAGRRCWSEA